MVEFGKKLAAWKHEPWSLHYLDYRRLKKALKVLKVQSDRQGVEFTGVKAEILEDLEKQQDPQYFRHLLDLEVEKIV
eukprot:2814830-Ditylum_brightwellii.AAC.1